MKNFKVISPHGFDMGNVELISLIGAYTALLPDECYYTETI